MRRIQDSFLLSILLLSATPSGAWAQTSCPTSPIPNGCSVVGEATPKFLAVGLNFLFLNACDHHDLCYGAPSYPPAPCKTFGWKFQCDAIFLAEMEATCLFYAGVLAYPASGWDTEQDFLNDCSAVAATFYGAVAAFGAGPFQCRQCINGCNESMCATIGRSYPPTGSGCPVPGCQSAPNTPPGGGGPCGTPITQTQTWILGPNGTAIPAPEQLDIDLERSEKRPHGKIFLEEWALVSTGHGLASPQKATENHFGTLAADALTEILPHPTRPTTALVVEAAIHAQDGREIPTPSLVPFQAQLGPNRPPQGQPIWFRAEFNMEGKVDRVQLLDPSQKRWTESLTEAIRTHLTLTYADDRMHRTIVHALAQINDQGQLTTIGNGLVSVPQCCCDGGPCAE